ncbi:NADH:flavin oxidoreductase/NADH oxidase [Soonwooa sp.]|uniref:NADH:flavin oxidoreductase/NADH oxidase n=1 Tax=Soonwooa sp. TaxID=1938592 RepID=UPI002602CA24|nr:NADH:flavin oxidoreductase/NADH oxidase [Soonwooa sp.]
MKLYEAINFRNLKLENRIVMSPMCMYSAKEGVATDFHFVHYGSRAQGGAGLIMIEATGVVPEGRITPKCLGLWNDKQQAELKRIVDFVHQFSKSKIGIQLAHSGRKGSTWGGKQLSVKDGGWQTVAPSAIPYTVEDESPRKLTIEEIKAIGEDFKKSAIRAVEAGFNIIEIHAAHGYLIHQFLSPLSNVRTDEYGGSFENRIRFLLEIVDAVSGVIDEDIALFVRISASEYADGGWDIDESVKLAEVLKTKSVDLIDVSSGGNIHGVNITLFNSYQVPFSQKIKQKSGMRTGAVGLITDAKSAEEILKNNEADLIFLARELLRNPYFPVLNSFEYGENCFFPKQYEKAKPEN